MKSSKIVRLPLYAQIKDAILQKLSQREWKFDQPLPSESKMADEFGVSVGSIRHAVAELEDAGILIRRQGVGTFVRSYKDTGLWNRFQKFMRKDGRLPVFESNPLRLEIIPAPENVAEKMKIMPGDPVIRCLRDMSDNGERTGVDVAYLDLATFRDLKIEDLEDVNGNLYKLYEEKLGVFIADVTDILEFVIVDKEIQKICDLPLGTPLFFVTRQSRLLNKKTVEIRYEYCSAVNYRLRI